MIGKLADQHRSTPTSETPDTAVDLLLADDEETHTTHAYACVRGQRERSETVEFRTLAAHTPDVSCEYSFRRRTIWHKAQGSIELIFMDGLRVLIEGVNLFDLKEKLRTRRVTWVAEQGTDPVEMEVTKRTAQQLAEPFVWIERITLTEADEMMHSHGHD